MRLRPPAPADAEAVTALLIAVDEAEVGEADSTLADLLQEWSAPGFDLARDAVLAETDRLAGYAAFRGSKVLMSVLSGQVDVRVALLDWCEARASERGHAHYEQAVAAGDEAGAALLRDRGYAFVRGYLRMARAVHDEPEPEPEPPRGVRLRPLRPGDRLYALNEAAFSTTADYEPLDEAEFERRHIRSHDLAPELSRVAERDGGPVGFALVHRWENGIAYLAQLAVHPRAAGAGIGTALLRAVFSAAAGDGLARVQLGVTSDNPRAVRLYERAGMTPCWRVDAYARPVLPD
jgi:ribosomal protein S18 acetylase RimI-like enzyme